MLIRLALATPVLMLTCLAAQAPFEGPAGGKVREGHQLLDAGKFNEALAAFNAGQALDANSSWPLSGIARLYERASQATDDAHREEYRARAEDHARRALELNDLDFIAMETLKKLHGGKQGSTYRPNEKAVEAFQRAEAHFGAKRFDEALKAYDEALAADGAYTDAWLYKGDCYFMQESYEKAAVCFVKATELEPNYARAWRFLADCRARMGQIPQAAGAAMQAIFVEPDDFTAWARYRQIRARQGVPEPERMKWPKVVSPKVGQKEGSIDIAILMSGERDESPESSAATTYQLIRGIQDAAASSSKTQAPELSKGPLNRELLAWEAALEALEKTAAEKKKPVKDAAWLRVLAFQKAGCLMQALVLLRYRETYRGEFEIWKKAHPEGLQDFLLRFQVRP